MLKYGVLVPAIPATLIFYGMGLVSASGYTIGEVKYLGILDVLPGLIAAYFLNYGLLMLKHFVNCKV